MFCDFHLGPDEDFADEDLIPLWATKILRSLTGRPIDVVFSQRQVDNDGATMGDPTHERRQTFSAVKLPGVCATCNNEWMSRIERAAKDVLEPIIRGVRTGIPVRNQLVIARWMALKTLVADLRDDGYPSFDVEDYHAFFADPNPPDRFWGRLGHIDTQGKDEHYMSAAPLLTSQSLDGVEAKTPLALETGMSLGPVYFLAWCFNRRTEDYPIPSAIEPDPYWTLVWPQDQEVSWPPPYTFTPDQLPDAQGNWPEAAQWIEENIRRPRRQ